MEGESWVLGFNITVPTGMRSKVNHAIYIHSKERELTNGIEDVFQWLFRADAPTGKSDCS